MTAPPADSLGLRVVRTGAARDVPWDEVLPFDLSPAGLRRLGDSWLHRYRMEHLAVGAFAMLVQETALVGASPIVLSMLSRAANDEVRHADLCRRYAVLLLGEPAVPRRLAGVSHVPAHPAHTPDARALLHVVEMCCVNETLTGAFLTELAARSTHPIAHALVLSLLEDEIDHGRVGWAYLKERMDEPWAAAVLATELPSMLERTLGPVLARAQATPEAEPAIERYGYLGARASAELTADVLRSLVLRGLAAAGLDTTGVERHLRARGWLRAP